MTDETNADSVVETEAANEDTQPSTAVDAAKTVTEATVDPAPAQDPTTTPDPVPAPEPAPEPAPTPEPAPVQEAVVIPEEPLEAVKETIIEKIADVITDVEKVFKKDAASEITGFQALVNDLNNAGTLTQKEIIRVFEDYVKHMDVNKPMDAERGIKYQVNLWKSILIVLTKAPREEFKSGWNLILNYFNTFRDTVFSEAYIHRFAAHWNISTVELKMFQAVINLLHLTCNPNTRQVGLKQVDMEKTLSTGFNDEARQRIMSFYQ